jgi:hypothetical protein
MIPAIPVIPAVPVTPAVSATPVAAVLPAPVQTPPIRANDLPKEQPSESCPPNQKMSLATGKCAAAISAFAVEDEECGGSSSDARQCTTGLICQFPIPTPPDAAGRCKAPPVQIFAKEDEECGESFFLGNQCAPGFMCKYEESEILNVFGKCIHTPSTRTS